MNILVRGTLVLAILAGTVLVAGSTAKGDVPEGWKSLDVVGLTSLAQQFIAKGDAGVDDCMSLAAYVAGRYATASAARQVNWDQWLDLAGQVFVTPPTAKLKKAGETITATDVVVKSKNKIECKFAIPAGAALGNWNIEVTNPAVDDDGDGNLEAAKSSNTDKTFEVTN